MDRQPLKPPFAYYGGKTILAQKIVDLLPAHKHYVEPFAGSLAVLLAKPATTWETVNDLDGLLVNFWRVLRDRPDELARAARLTPHSRSEYEAAARCDLDGLDDLERARLAWVRITQGRAHSLDGKSGWRYGKDAAKERSWPGYLSSYAARMEAASERLRNVSLENRDALELINEYGQTESTCLYVDPPYAAETRVALNQYRMDNAGSDFHERLAAALNDCKASVVLSGYASGTYRDLYSGWYSVELKAPVTQNGGARTEVLWSNRPIGEPDLFSTLGDAS